jgi:hypothetical protein
VFISNRWAALDMEGQSGFQAFCSAQGFSMDKGTAAIIDLDKTAIAARGRNASVIDQARVQAVRDTVEKALGSVFKPEVFRAAYDCLDTPDYHSFTLDNQDYIAYVCLIISSGLVSLAEVVDAVKMKRTDTFRQFIDQVDTRKSELPGGLVNIHSDIYANVLAGDPTPFKPFRRNEYRNTIGRMGYLADSASVEQMVSSEIVITQEVRSIALKWRNQGMLMFGLSDKPDEASIPTPDLADQGYLTLHQKVTHVVGEA